jgi:putative DNA primase/helicase
MSEVSSLCVGTVDQLLSRLEHAKRSGSGWTARCPAHEDRHASLSLDENSAGDVLVYCHAGCKTEDVLAAVGLTLRALFADGYESTSP